VREQCGKAGASDAELLCKDRRCVAGLLCEMRECGGVDPDYATVISGWCKSGRIEDVAKVFNEMLARAILKNARVLLLDEASRVQDAVGRMLQRCARQRCAGRSHTVREELCDGSGRIRTGTAGPRMEDIGSR
jgi:pentatricopeptide repeat protein